MQKKILIILMIVITHSYSATLAHGLNLKRSGILAVCSYSRFIPISYGNGEGFEADILKSVAKYWQVKIKFYPSDLYEGLWLMPSKANSPCDVAIGGFSATTSRIKQGAIFSHSTVTFDQSLLIRRSDYVDKKITSYQSFKNSTFKIGVVPGTDGEKHAHERAAELGILPIIFKQYKSENELLPALKAHQIDAIARGEIGNDYQAHLDNSLMTIDKRNFNESFAISVNPHNPDLLLKLNIAISMITHNGQISYSDWLNNKQVFESSIHKK